MKYNHCILSLLLGIAFSIPTTILAEQTVVNRLTFSTRLGFNVSGGFVGFTPPAARTTPHGDAYNYDNGYVLTDITGNLDGLTWYWGYDNSARQVSGNTIFFDCFPSVPPTRLSDSEPFLGAELSYKRELGKKGVMHYGLEGAVNFLRLNLHDARTFPTRIRDAYSFGGTRPPHAPPPNLPCPEPTHL